ncbi:MAG: BREX system ATP-binding domain-containing protein [Chloroflexota bacterium]
MSRSERTTAIHVVEALRKGIPPRHGVGLYSVGHEKLLDGISKYHLQGIEDQGIIRFMSGSWGAGKTHFFRLVRELAFKHECLVSNVELNVHDAALDKFERVFYSIISSITTPLYYEEDTGQEAAPFGAVVRESLAYLATGLRDIGNEITHDGYQKASETLMTDRSIDIDFKKMIQKYWETFLPEAAEPIIQEQTRAEILQWFSGEGSAGTYRRRFGVTKIVSKDNAKLMLRSLAAFVRLSGYKGLVILFDEAEQAFSIMKTSQLKDAQNNLLSLINNIEGLTGLYMIYATTPDFYTDPKKGIIIYGALAGRIGKPEDRAPRALQNVWNFDAEETALADYIAAARKIRAVYLKAHPGTEKDIPDEGAVESFVDALFQQHPTFSGVRFWRVLVTALVTHFDDILDGDVRPVEKLYDHVIDRLREE